MVAFLFSAWQRVELLSHGYKVEQMQKDRAVEADVARHLRLEIATLRSPSRIERLATRDLQMVAPGVEDAAVIERVIPASPPPRSIVARR